MFRTLMLIVLFALLAGCASTPKVPAVISGTATAPQLLPYSRSAEGFVADVTAKVGEAADDEATTRWLRAALEKHAPQAVEQFRFDNSDEGRARLTERLFKKQLPDALTAGGGFVMTKQANLYSNKGEIKNAYIRLGAATGDSQPFSGSLKVGKKFSSYNSSTRSSMDDEESYAASLAGSLAWLADGTLSASWQLTEGEHKSSFGLDSRFSLAGASEGLAGAIAGARSLLDGGYLDLVNKTAEAAKGKISNRYTRREVKANDDAARLEGEFAFPIKLDTAISRIQRQYQQWKFDPTSSTFSIEAKDRYVDPVVGRQSPILMVSLFPEEDGKGIKTVVLFKVLHTNVFDQITGKTVYGAADAARLFDEDIKRVKSSLGK